MIRLHFLKQKGKKLNISVVKERKNNYYELNIQHTLLNGIPLPSAPLIDDRASFPKNTKKRTLNSSVKKERKRNYYK